MSFKNLYLNTLIYDKVLIIPFALSHTLYCIGSVAKGHTHSTDYQVKLQETRTVKVQGN